MVADEALSLIYRMLLASDGFEGTAMRLCLNEEERGTELASSCRNARN
jgi:hypothetical protein